MAVVQISRIQIRRGKSLTGTGLPQLASGELAWALDTQELFIGNGSVAEGSPAVGNTKILTERDLTAQGNLLNLLSHIYKSNDPAIQTGPTANAPISRQVQDRLDDRVTGADFGTLADGSTDDTDALQRAIDQLYLNDTTKASIEDDADSAKTRVILELGPGIYNITSTIYVPSYVTLIGAGSDKTILSYSGAGPTFQFVNDTSTAGSPATLGSTQGNTQPRHIIFKGFTIKHTSENKTGLLLNAVKDSYFEDLVIHGNWDGTQDLDSSGISLSAVSSIVTSQDNIFKRIVFRNFSQAVLSRQDILNNVFDDCYFTNCRQGIVLGDDADGATAGEQYGPRETTITNCKFEDIKRHAVLIGLGTGNTVRGCKLVNVGNNGAGVYFPDYPQIYLGSVGNSVEKNFSDRSEALASLSFTADLTLSSPITATKDSLVTQAGSVISATLKENYTSDSTITVVSRYSGSFNTTGILTIADNNTPGNTTTIEIIGSDAISDVFETVGSTSKMIVGTEITFTGSLGGVTAGTSYWVQTIVDDTHFAIANSLGGSRRSLSSTTGSMYGSYHPTVKPTVVGSSEIVPYVPEVAGYGTFKSYSTREVLLGSISSPSLICTLPVSSGSTGNPSRSITYLIEYIFRGPDHTRSGTITLSADIDNSVSSSNMRLTDEYVITGITEEESLLLDFSAVLLNQDGSPFAGGGDLVKSIALRYSNGLDSGTFIYSYTAIC